VFVFSAGKCLNEARMVWSTLGTNHKSFYPDRYSGPKGTVSLVGWEEGGMYQEAYAWCAIHTW
jgi:hypothetical protein